MIEPKETTRERFDRQVREQGGVPAYEVWQGTRKPHRVLCKEGHECNSYPCYLQQGGGICRKCTGNDPEQAEDNFLQRLKELGATPLYEVWQGVMKAHRVICEEGHECNPCPNSIQRGRGVCAKCAGNDTEQAEYNFLARLKALGAEPVYYYWRGVNKPHRVICKEGHECNPRPNSIQRGNGLCRKCARRDPEQAEENFRARLKELGAAPAYDEWQGARKPHRVICKEGHESNPRPNSIRQGKGPCRKCAGYREFDVFYVVRSPRECVVKYGVTSGDSRPRLRTHKNNGFTEIWYLKMNFEGAGPLEDAVDLTLKDAGFEPVYGLEYFRDDALPFILSLCPDSDWSD